MDAKLKTAVTDTLRATRPSLRRYSVVGIVTNGGSTRVYECCVCGSAISMSNNWPMTVRVIDFIDHHEHHCGLELLRENGVAIEVAS